MGRFDIPQFKGRGWVEGSRIVWESEGDLIWLEAYGENSLRLRSSKSLRIDEQLNWNLLPQGKDDAVIELTDEKAIIRNGKIWAEVLGNGTVNYYDHNNNPLLREYWVDEREMTANLRPAREFTPITGDVFKIDLYFKANPTEHFHGMGQDPNDCFDLKGSTIPLEQKNTKCSIPFAVSNLGYGFLWNNPSIGQVEFVANHTKWHAEAAKQIDYIIIAGDSPDEIMRQYTEITGRAPVLPKWAAGFWQCKLRYETQEELLQVAREYQKRGIPVSVLVVDFFHWTRQGEWKFDPVRWPDPKAMVDELREMGIRLMVSIWPTVDSRSENYIKMRDTNCLVRAERGTSLFKMFHGDCTFFDATHPRAREFVWNKAKENYYASGIKMFWLDESEPSFAPYHYENVRYYMGNGLEVSNLYPYYYGKAFYDGLKSQGETEIVNLIRCAWIGSQRNSAIVWSGDIESSFDSLRKQIKAGLNFSFSGIPWWTTDIGGFWNGDPYSESFRELLVRWFAFGVFCPIFRLHGNRLPYADVNMFNPDAYKGSGGPNEVWSFGEENYTILVDFIAMRQRLLPYIMEQMELASKTGTPVMRPLLYDFYKDEMCQCIDDEYMFGSDVLVAPVISAGCTKRMVYLPKGSEWEDPYTNASYQGGQSIEVNAPMNRIPLFLRDGAKLPIVDTK
ncbi:MAG: TIM-barrel domain-containing protein [Acetanaerobacterium sp.]